MIAVWICLVLMLIWVIGITLLILGHINFMNQFVMGQEQVNEIIDKRHWSLDERVTMINDRVNNIKRRI